MDAQVTALAARLGCGAEQILAMADGLTAADLRRALAFVETQETENALVELSFDLAGEGRVAKRPRSVRITDGAGQVVGVRTYAPDGGAQRTIRQEVRGELPEGFIPLEGEVALELHVRKPMLSGWPPYKRLLAELGYLRPEVKPDYDNYAKLVTDAMRGVVFKDDSQVVIGQVTKAYSVRPGINVRVQGRRRRMSK